MLISYRNTVIIGTELTNGIQVLEFVDANAIDTVPVGTTSEVIRL